MSTLLAIAQHAPPAPTIDYKELSPLLALAGGSVIVLMVGLLGSRFVRTLIVPVLSAVVLLTAIGLTIWIWEPGNRAPILEGALGVDTLALGMSMLFYVAGLVTIVLSLRSHGHRAGRAWRVPRAAAPVDRRHGRARGGGEPDDAVHRLRAALDPALRPVRDAPAAADLAGGRAEVPRGGLGGIGHAPVRPRARLRSHRRARVRRDCEGARQRHRERLGPAAAQRHRALRDRAGLQGVGGALPPMDARRLPGRAHADHHLHGGGHQGCRIRCLHQAVRPRLRPRPARLGRRRSRCSRP